MSHGYISAWAPRTLILVWCLVGVESLSGRCLEGDWKVSGRCQEGVRKVSGTLWKASTSRMCLPSVNKVLSSKNHN